MKLATVLVCGVAAFALLGFVANSQAELITAGLIQHLDADMNVTATGTSVTSWAPVAGTGDTVTTSAGSPQLNTAVLNGHNTISFTADQMNGTNTSLFDFAGDLTWYAVVRYSPTSATATNVFGTLQNSGGYYGLELDSNGSKMSARFRSSTAVPIVTETTDSRGSWHVYTGRRSGSTVEFYVDGRLRGTAANAGTIASDALAVGADRTGGTERANFDVAFLGFYNTALSSVSGGQLEQMVGYLGNRYIGWRLQTSDVIKWNFEHNNLGDTTQTNFFSVVSGSAFDYITDGTASQPIPYDLLDGHTATVDSVNPNGGNYLVRTDYAVNFPAADTVTKPGDGPTGVMESAPFTLPSSEQLVSLMLSADMAGQGGMLQLVRESDDAVLATLNASLGSTTLAFDSTSILVYAGETVFLRITDNSSAGWGHIAIDNILISQTLAVPEPSSFALAGLVGTLALGFSWRRKKRA